MRDPGRPPGHPLVELAYDLRAAVDRALSDDAQLAAPRAQVWQRLHETLDSARRLVDAVERLVEGLEAQANGAPQERPDDVEAQDDDFQIIRVSTG